MPVLTPLWPAANAAHNLSSTTARTIRRELDRAAALAPAVGRLAAADQWGRPAPLGDLASRREWCAVAADGGPEFFGSYESYLRIDVAAGSEAGLGRWRALIESSLGSLVRRLERVPALDLRPFPRAYAARPAQTRALLP
jgi:poly(A) polymerase Pap1